MSKYIIKNGSIDNDSVDKNLTQNHMIDKFLERVEDITRSTTAPMEVDCNKPDYNSSTSFYNEQKQQQNKEQSQVDSHANRHGYESDPSNLTGVDETLILDIIAENDRLRHEIDEFLDSNSYLVVEDINDDDDGDGDGDALFESICMPRKLE